jgi:hypothetical protein
MAFECDARWGVAKAQAVQRDRTPPASRPGMNQYLQRFSSFSSLYGSALEKVAGFVKKTSL